MRPRICRKRGSVKWLGETFLPFAGNLLILNPPLAITEEEVDPDVTVGDDAISVATR